MKKLLISFIFILLLANISYAQKIIVNSEEWTDVYSSLLYATLAGEDANFLVSDKHGTIILDSIPKITDVVIFSSRRNPFMVGYESIVRNQGYNVEERIYDDFNLELAELLDVSNFIILDDAYGYNAVSVAPYAAVSDSYVLFASQDNINEIDDFLSQRVIDDLIIYGNVDREVRNTLQKYTPEIINKEGDRFDNNIEIVKKYQGIRHGKQALLTNGEFIEKEIMSGVEPVVFIGTNNVPDQVREYLQESEIDVGILVGNELVGTATYIRRQVGISVFVKFAQSARSPQGAISQVEALDMFYLPTYILNMQLDSMKYNKATNKVEVTLQNTEDQAVFFKGTYNLIPSGGSEQKFGDIIEIFLDGNEIKTLTYDVEPITDGKIIVEAYIIYGESKGSMEKIIDTSIEIDIVDVVDNCEMAITGFLYDNRRKYFYTEIENLADVICYADSEVVDIFLNGQRTTLGSDKIIEIAPGEKGTSRIKARLEEEDIADNEMVQVKVYYGERENSLIKTLEAQMELIIKSIDYLFYTLIAVILLLIFLIFWKRRKKKKEQHHK
ncbi:MAG: hypothetical protein ABIC04_04875 [Nanoarchaeota archaeon]